MHVNEAFSCVTADDNRAIRKVVDRALRDIPTVLRKRDRMDLEMDLIACHLIGCKLDLDRLLAAAPFDFAHDVLGIRQHIDRDTGNLTGFFLPRFASVREIVREQVEAAQ